MKMVNTLMRSAAVAALALAWPYAATAQTSHEAHHPAGGEQASPAAPAAQPPAETAPGSAGSSGATGTQPGTMAGMGGQQGTMGMPMMNMMGQGGTMMGMMDMTGAGGGGMPAGAPCGPGMAGTGTIDHIEGWIAFLRTELKITDAQTTAWEQLADAMRANAKELGKVRKATMEKMAGGQTPTLSQRLDAEERWLTARVKGVSAIKASYEHLYDALSEDQKKAAEELIAPHLGMGPMAMGPMRGAKP